MKELWSKYGVIYAEVWRDAMTLWRLLDKTFSEVRIAAVEPCELNFETCKGIGFIECY